MLPRPNVIVRRTAAVTGVGLVLALPVPAAAHMDPGINYDPGSPAGKEYAIPLVEGRTEGAGTTDQRRGGNIPFGVGIAPPGSGGSGGSSGKSGGADSGERRARGQHGAGRSKDGGAGAGRAVESPESQNARLAEAESAGGTAGQTLLIALAVMLSAALLALLLRA